ncbi:MAG: hypothetical protein U9M96_00430 [Thermodesulfobacteriota bacterium]|nr:hypothetical protein [Thermodesulfobacteriota bacterium]
MAQPRSSRVLGSGTDTVSSSAIDENGNNKEIITTREIRFMYVVTFFI